VGGLQQRDQGRGGGQARVKKDVGVLFKLTVVSGRDIAAYSYLPKENEILLSPNTRFTVASELDADEDGSRAGT
jgi:hypothetical protein